jgi:hypothetical protein
MILFPFKVKEIYRFFKLFCIFFYNTNKTYLSINSSSWDNSHLHIAKHLL